MTGPATVEVACRPAADYGRRSAQTPSANTTRCGEGVLARSRLRSVVPTAAEPDERPHAGVHAPRSNPARGTISCSAWETAVRLRTLRQLWQSTEAAWRERAALPRNRDPRRSGTPAKPTRSCGASPFRAEEWSPPRRWHYPNALGPDAPMTTGTPGSATRPWPARRLPRSGADDLLDGATSFLCARLLTDGPNLAPAYTVSGGRLAGPATAWPPGVPRWHGRRGKPRQQAVPTRCVRREPVVLRRSRSA